MPATTRAYVNTCRLRRRNDELTCEESPEDELLACRGRSTPIILVLPVAVLALTLLSEHKPVAYATTSLQHIRVLGRIVAFARNVRTAQLELRRQRSLTGPLNVFVIVVGAGVGAAHDVHFIQAPCIATHAL